MKGFAQVFLLELRLRRAVFPAALVTGLIPIPMALLMKSVATFSESVSVGAAAFAFIGGELLALYLGATVLCQDLSEGRQGFYLSKPIGALALWAGKLSAAWVAVLGAVFVCLLPATFFGGGVASVSSVPNPFWVYNLGPQEFSPLGWPLLCALVVLALLTCAHALSVMFRARSRWLILDAVMVVLLPTLAWWALRRILALGSLYLLLVEVVILCLGLLVAPLAAGAVQMASGRADLRRGHRALSLTLWGLLGLAVLGVDAHALWVTNVSPSSLARVEAVTSAPEGPWMAVAGPLRHRGPDAWGGFLVNGETGAWLNLRPSHWANGVTFSPDGRLAVYCDSRSLVDNAPAELMACDLTASRAEPKPTGIVPSGYRAATAFSPDGSRLAIAGEEDLAVYDLPSWKLAAAQKLEQGGGRCYFQDRDTIRLLRMPRVERASAQSREAALDILEFKVGARKLVRTGGLEGVQPWTVRVNGPGDRMLALERSAQSSRLILCDAVTGSILKVLASGADGRSGAFLRDGRILVSQRLGNDAKSPDAARSFTVYSRDGAEQRSIHFEGKRFFSWGAQPEPGKIFINTWSAGKSDAAEVFLLDAEGGTVKVLQGFRPASIFGAGWSDPRLETSTGGSSAQMFLDGQGRLVRYDFKTGNSTPVKF